jgi:hypothetical protein
MTFLLFVTAISLSVVAAWYAIAGLVAIFAAAVVPIMVMGSLLEISKLVVASWLYRSWGEIPRLMKAYFVVALVILMALTSMGIFGYLSKAHLDQAIPTGDAAARVEIIDERIAIEQDVIVQYRKDLTVLNDQIDRYNELGAVTKGVKAREDQKEERTAILNKIEESQNKVTTLRDERAPYSTQMRKIEAEVGPLKYIATVIYGENPDKNLLESAVRIVIMMIVFVFDPLAVLMLIGANWSLKNNRPKVIERVEPPLTAEVPKEEVALTEDPIKKEFPHNILKKDQEEPEPVYEADDGALTEEQVEQVQDSAKEIPSVDDIKVEEPLESELNEKHKRNVGRFLSELDQKKPDRTTSFLNKVGNVTEKGVGINSIEYDVTDLQIGPAFTLDDDNKK